MQLGDYLKAAMARPFAWGSHDCATLPADWVLARTPFAPDPMAAWRGRYDDADSADAIMVAEGGLQSIWSVCCADAGFVQIGDYEVAAGDIGLCWFRGELGAQLAGSICVGPGRWAALTPTGLLVGPARSAAAWRL